MTLYIGPDLKGFIAKITQERASLEEFCSSAFSFQRILFEKRKEKKDQQKSNRQTYNKVLRNTYETRSSNGQQTAGEPRNVSCSKTIRMYNDKDHI